MAEQALVVDMGRVLTARLLKNDGIEGISHCALGDGDVTFTDPENPPAPSADQTTLKNEFVRKRSHRTAFLAEDLAGPYDIGGTLYGETETETPTIAVFFRFEDHEGNASITKEIGFFGGDVAYVEGVTGDTATGGIYDETTNPDGEVLDPGYLYEVRNIPDYQKEEHTMLELVAIVNLVQCPA